jgi:hypothetical protein
MDATQQIAQEDELREMVDKSVRGALLTLITKVDSDPIVALWKTALSDGKPCNEELLTALIFAYLR